MHVFRYETRTWTFIERNLDWFSCIIKKNHLIILKRTLN
jgi:hypothetical protein